MSETPHFTDEQLARVVRNPATTLESQLAQTVIDDRAVLRQLREEIAPMAAQIICPPENTFMRQLSAIDSRLP